MHNWLSVSVNEWRKLSYHYSLNIKLWTLTKNKHRNKRWKHNKNWLWTSFLLDCVSGFASKWASIWIGMLQRVSLHEILPTDLCMQELLVNVWNKPLFLAFQHLSLFSKWVKDGEDMITWWKKVTYNTLFRNSLFTVHSTSAMANVLKFLR